jgi:hypothetical protein
MFGTFNGDLASRLTCKNLNHPHITRPIFGTFVSDLVFRLTCKKVKTPSLYQTHVWNVER